MSLFSGRAKRHDQMENELMDVIRPFTTRKHLPDKFISLNNKLYAFDTKTTVCVEKNSHDEYFRLFNENGIPVFIVYYDKDKCEILANWIQQLNWRGPLQASAKSTSGDPFYVISNGMPLQRFIERECGYAIPTPRANQMLEAIKRIAKWLGINDFASGRAK